MVFVIKRFRMEIMMMVVNFTFMEFKQIFPLNL
jgi:hypothetical protein